MITIQGQSQPDMSVKVLILGDAGVGKTSLTSRFADGSFIKQYISTIGVDFKTKMIKLEDKKIKYQVWDTAGQERFRSIAKAYYRGVQGILLAFSVTDRQSFENIEEWMVTISENTENQCSKVLVGTKVDCEEERVVSFPEAEQLAKKIGIQYIETSAKENMRVSEAFNILGEQAFKKWKEEQGRRVQNAKRDYVVIGNSSKEKEKNCNC